MSPVPHTTADIAGEMWISERSAQQRLQIARNLDRDLKDRLAGSELANSRSQLLELARTDPGDQRLAIDLVLRCEADNLRHAAVLLSLDPDALRWLAGTKLCESVTELAKLEPFTPDDLRRTFAGDLLDAGADLVTAQKLMGHSNPSTTAGYDRRTEKAKRKAVAALSVPYTRRYRNGKDKTA